MCVWRGCGDPGGSELTLWQEGQRGDGSPTCKLLWKAKEAMGLVTSPGSEVEDGGQDAHQAL